VRQAVDQHLAEERGKDQLRSPSGRENAEQAEEPVPGLVAGDEAANRLPPSARRSATVSDWAVMSVSLAKAFAQEVANDVEQQRDQQQVRPAAKIVW
jgi:hypothetical protein